VGAVVVVNHACRAKKNFKKRLICFF